MNLADIRWIAGFLEGEGSFRFQKNKDGGGTVKVEASQCQHWPLARLQSLLSGHIYARPPRGRRNAFFIWYLAGANAAGLMMTLYSELSPRRREQIRTALSLWRGVKPGPKFRAHCKQGHPYGPDNTYKYRGARQCRSCQRRRSNEWKARSGYKSTESVRRWYARQRLRRLGASAVSAAEITTHPEEERT